MAYARYLLEQVVAAVAITGPTSFSWFGTPSPPLPSRLRRRLPLAMARSHLVFTLTNHLYDRFYRIGFASSVPPEAGDTPVSCRETQLVAALSSANRGHGYWEPGWIVQDVDGPLVALRRDALTVWVSSDDYRPASGVELGIGAEVSVPMRNESINLSPGYYSAMGDEPLTWDAADDSRALVRLYWNIGPTHAADLVEAFTGVLNSPPIPFRLKVLVDAVSYTRCDTAVLYLLEPDVSEAAVRLAGIWDTVRPGMRSGTPAFTKEIAFGVGLAEDPGHGESFGQHRCRALAEALVRADERAQRALSARMETVEEVFTECGIDLRHPHLNNRGRVGRYDVRLALPPTTGRAASGPAPTEAMGRADFQLLAESIAERVCADALWHGDRCNWLGLMPQSYGAGQVGLSYGSLASDLYDGTAGVAVFLGVLHHLTGAEAAGQTAAGAVRQALSAVEGSDDPARGLFDGAAGIAVAAALLGRLLDDDEIVSRGRRLAGRIAGDARRVPGFDLISGSAGVACALVVLADLLDEPQLLSSAAELGDDLLVRAERTDLGWSWQSPDAPRTRNLTGFSHGTAGVGSALLALLDVTGDGRLREAVNEAFRYERSCFDAGLSNWPDFRDEPAGRTTNGPSTRFRTQWCHGAPGIALSRLQAYELLGGADYREDALTALATTERYTAQALDGGTLSWCLCHGLAGNADVLIEGRQVLLPADTTTWRHVPEAIGAAGIAAHGSTDVPWPCGIPVPGRETPGLMLGLAGIGYFYLRLAFPGIPSPLLLRRQGFRSLLDSHAVTSVDRPRRKDSDDARQR